jgi:hypothetical protein
MFTQFRKSLKRYGRVMLRCDVAFPEPEKSTDKSILPKAVPGNLKMNGHSVPNGNESDLMIVDLQRTILQLMAANCGWDVSSAGKSGET